MRNEEQVDVGAVERELEDLGKVIRRAAGELTEKLDRRGVGDLDVTVTLNWINTLRRRREVMILELARRGWRGNDGGKADTFQHRDGEGDPGRTKEANPEAGKRDPAV